MRKKDPAGQRFSETVCSRCAFRDVILQKRDN
jgi:hypothetical protein